MNKRTIKNFQPEPKSNSELKADEKLVSPAIAKSPCNQKTVEAVKKVVK